MRRSSRRVASVVLAAGRASRLGFSKTQLAVDGTSVLARLRDVFAACELFPRIVVLGAESEVVTEDESLPNPKRGGSSPPGMDVRDHDITVRGDENETMIDSFARAIAVMGKEIEAIVVQPIDAPFTSVPLVCALVARWEASGEASLPVVPVHGERPGHPVLVPRDLFGEIALRPEGGLGGILAGHARDSIAWPNDEILADIDTMADLARWRGWGLERMP